METDIVDQVLDKLIEARLIRTIPDTTLDDEQVELTHETLIHSWPQYQKWLQEEELNRYRRWRLAKDAQDWVDQGRPGNLLLQQGKLKEVESYTNLSQLEEEFVQVSKKVVEELQSQEKQREARLKLLEAEVKTLRTHRRNQRLRLETLEAELQTSRLSEERLAVMNETLESMAAELLIQKRHSKRDRLLAIICLVLAFIATGVVVIEAQRVPHLDTEQNS